MPKKPSQNTPDPVLTALRQRLADSKPDTAGGGVKPAPPSIPQEARKALLAASAHLDLIKQVHRILADAGYSSDRLRLLPTIKFLCKELQVDPATPMGELPPLLIQAARLRVLDYREQHPKGNENDPPQFTGSGLIVFPDGWSIRLDGAEADVVECLVELRAATKPDLESKSGRSEAVRVLRAVCRKHDRLAGHITFPGGKGCGGYSTTIVDGRDS